MRVGLEECRRIGHVLDQGRGHRSYSMKTNLWCSKKLDDLQMHFVLTARRALVLEVDIDRQGDRSAEVGDRLLTVVSLVALEGGSWDGPVAGMEVGWLHDDHEPGLRTDMASDTVPG